MAKEKFIIDIEDHDKTDLKVKDIGLIPLFVKDHIQGQARKIGELPLYKVDKERYHRVLRARSSKKHVVPRINKQHFFKQLGEDVKKWL